MGCAQANTKQQKFPAIEEYILPKVLGSGVYGEVYFAKNRRTQMSRAIKIFKKQTIQAQKKIQKQMVDNEFQSLAKLDHPFLLKVFEIREDDDYFYIITELLTGGELYTQLVEKTIKEQQAANLIYQLLTGIIYLHNKTLVHRDLKPENLIFETSKRNILKLIDFGTATHFDVRSNKKMSDITGTQLYMSPQVTLREYTEKCDVWSCGMILYVMLAGKNPFTGMSNEDQLLMINSDQIPYPMETFKVYSNAVTDLLKKFLVYNENKRISTQEAIKHQWIQAFLELEKVRDRIPSILEELINYNVQSSLQVKLKKMYINEFLTTEIPFEMRKEFIEITPNRIGILPYKKLEELLNKHLSYTQQNIQSIIQRIRKDLGHDEDVENLTYSDYLILRFKMQDEFKRNKKRIQQLFLLLTEGSNSLSISKFKEIFKTKVEEIDYVKNQLNTKSLEEITHLQFSTLIEQLQ